MTLYNTNNSINIVTVNDIKAPGKYTCVGGPFGSSLSRKHYIEIEGVPVIRGTNLGDDWFQDEDYVYVSEEKANDLHRNIAFPGDLVFTQRGTLGQVAVIPENAKYKRYVVSQSQMKLTVNKKLADPYFVYSYFRTEKAKKDIIDNAITSGVPHINLGILKSIEIPLPSLSRQKTVVKTIKALDNKIYLNRQINQTMEQIAQAIFKSWFVDFDPVKAKIAAKEVGCDPERAAMAAIAGKTEEQLDRLSPEQLTQLAATAALFPDELIDSELGEIPRGWEIKALDEIAHYQNGLALQKFRPKDKNNYLPVVKIAQLKKGFADGAEKASPNINPECIIDNGDVVFPWSGSLMVDIWCGGKGALNQHLFKVSSNYYPKWLYYCWTKHHLNVFQQIAADKAVTMGHIKRSHLKEALCVIPDIDLRIINLIGDLMVKQIECKSESNTLGGIRDSLLPKLLSGEMRLSNELSE